MRLAAAACLLVALLAAADDAGAPEEGADLGATIEQRVLPERVKLGEPFVRTLTVTHDPSHRFELRAVAGAPELEFLGHDRRRQDQGGRATTTFTVQMSAFALGQVALPPVHFDVDTPEGERTFASSPTKVEVVESLPDDAPVDGAVVHDIRPPEPVPVPSYAILWAALAAAAAALLAYLAWRWWHRPRPEAPEVVPTPSPVERARAALADLAREKLPAQGRFKEFYIRLSEIVRAYVGERYGVDALELTTFELIGRLLDLPVFGLDRAGLARFLNDADLVKFARESRTPEECDRALEFARDLVERTAPASQPADVARNVP